MGWMDAVVGGTVASLTAWRYAGGTNRSDSSRPLWPLQRSPGKQNTQVGVTYQHSVSHAEEVKMIISHFFIVFFILLFYALRNCF